LLRELIESLGPPRGFLIIIGANMPTLIARRVPLAQVFSNLMSNAVKHHHHLPGKIMISVQDQGDRYEFSVADDGNGIAPRDHERIFEVFQTASTRSDPESSGIGLAIVKKIVESEGGTIRLESDLGQGATFYFSWLKQPRTEII
jgi:signal transduction histidine kinase